jgi:hypothetical protein
MAWSQSDLDAIEVAIKSGTTMVKYDTKTVTYRSLDELIRIRELIKKELGQTTGASARVYMETSKGIK